jgi:predicted PurR-regulated permease PerM
MGFVGMFPAVPITAVLKISLGKFQNAVPVANLLAAKAEKNSIIKRND